MFFLCEGGTPMCGIVGYAGHRQAAPVLLDGLSKLEYRGYDSAGLCVYSPFGLEVAKAKGRLQVLSDMTRGGESVPGCMGIGHTRWATHGAPSDRNSHPHLSDDGVIAVVHNGIIENYLELRERLTSEGFHFRSDTDTEVVSNLIARYYRDRRDLLYAVRQAVARLRGSYALGVLCREEPDRMVAVKKDSPLIFGFGQGENFIASDVPAILKYTRQVAYLDDGDMAVFNANSVSFYNALGEHIHKKREEITWQLSAAERGGYPHFMLKEIHEQPRALRDTIAPHIRDGRVTLGEAELSGDFLRSLRRIYIVACGSSGYVGCLGKYILEKTCRIPVEPILASEFRYADPILNEDTLVIAISQSGETADTLAAVREATRQGARTLAICNVVGSAIAKAADRVIYTCAGPEIAVATTKAYSCQLAVIYLLNLYMAQTLGTMTKPELEEALEALRKLPEQAELALREDQVAQSQHYASALFDNHDVFFIGRNLDSATCLEGSLKLKEVAYIHSEAYAAGELKHGPISLLEPGTLVVAVACVESVFDKTMANMKEVKARGAEVLCLTLERLGPEAAKTADYVMTVPETHPMFQPSLNVIPLQTFAYYAALARGCDVDKPRNLAKSVTVE